MNKESLLSIIRNAPIEEVLKFKVDVMKVIVNYQNLYSKTVLMLALTMMWAVFLLGLGLNVDNTVSRFIIAACFSFTVIRSYKTILVMKEIRSLINEDLELLQAAEKRIQVEAGEK